MSTQGDSQVEVLLALESKYKAVFDYRNLANKLGTKKMTKAQAEKIAQARGIGSATELREYVEKVERGESIAT